jgi:hypothetical protein
MTANLKADHGVVGNGGGGLDATIAAAENGGTSIIVLEKAGSAAGSTAMAHDVFNTTAGCWESESYCYRLTGHLVGFALNSGRIAGENAVKYPRSQEQEVNGR